MRFLKRYFEEMRFLENSPLDAKSFLTYCEKLGLKYSLKDLEYFEKEKLLFPIFRLNRPKQETEWICFKKDGSQKKRPKFYGLLEGEVFIETKIEIDYVRPTFHPESHADWLALLENGHISNPGNDKFKSWKEFREGNHQLVDSFYSSYQALWLANIQQRQRSINIGIRYKDSLSVDSNGDLVIKGIKQGRELKTIMEGAISSLQDNCRSSSKTDPPRRVKVTPQNPIKTTSFDSDKLRQDQSFFF